MHIIGWRFLHFSHEFSHGKETDPLVAVFRLHPVIGDEIEKFGVFLDRWDTNKEVICSLVWSNTDNAAVTLPVVGLNPYPVITSLFLFIYSVDLLEL